MLTRIILTISARQFPTGPNTLRFYLTYSFLRNLVCAFHASENGCRLYGSRRSAIELPGDVNDSSCHEKVDYSCFSALCSGDGAVLARAIPTLILFEFALKQRRLPRTSATAARSHQWNVTHNLAQAEIYTPVLSVGVTRRPPVLCDISKSSVVADALEWRREQQIIRYTW